MSKDTGGAAFPKPKLMQQVASFDHEEGMTLRDYFAAKAMQSIFESQIETTSEGKDYLAMHAYEMADAMLKARK